MTPFLKYVAADLRQKFGNDLSHVCVVFPNKRAALFFNDYLAEETSQPIWAPQYLSISELLRSFSAYNQADSIDTICRLYNIFVETTGNHASLDFFWGWGERLLADFEDIDKNNVDARRLFRHLRDIKELENNDWADEKQEEILKEFFNDFSLKKNSEIKERFLLLWNNLYAIYEQLNNDLKAEGLAYEGAIHRDAVERLRLGLIPIKAEQKYAFVGFNVLTQTEKDFFALLRDKGNALFYWDYDKLYVDEGTTFEAGTFLKQNLINFPNELKDDGIFNNFTKDKKIDFVAAPTENTQAKSTYTWLNEHLSKEEKKTAIVLCNEVLLQSVLHAIPDSVQNINITKGFPLAQTQAFSFVEELAQKSECLSPLDFIETLLEKVQCTAKNEKNKKRDNVNDFEQELYAESYFQVYTILNRFHLLISSGKLPIETVTLHKLIRQVVRQTSIPFHGEPAIGLQIMGVLETRCLDFENILMLSVNEGNLPQKNHDNSFIPYCIKKEFGLTTAEHKTAVYAYYFYRLIQRAKHIRLVYNSSTEGMVKGEMSRFMTQLLVETELPIKHYILYEKIDKEIKQLETIKKPQNLPEILQEISPSAINAYMRCQLQFYFQRIARLKEVPSPGDVIEYNTFGTIFHRVAEKIYNVRLTQHKGLVSEEFLKSLLDKDGEITITKYIRETFQENELTPNVVIEQVVKNYIKLLIQHDLKLVPFKIEGTEKNTEVSLDVPYKDGFKTIKLKGNIDRLDLIEIDGLTTLRVVDYKTGGKSVSPTFEQLFISGKNHPHYVLQTFLYALTLVDSSHYPIAPALFFVHQAANDEYSPYIKIGPERKKKYVYDFREIAKDFKESITHLLEEILCPDTEFKATDDSHTCATCPYSKLCNRN